MALLLVNDLRTYFHTRSGTVRAVDGISYSVGRGETLGIVGESGSGKSVSQYAQLGLLPVPPGKVEGGEAVFDGEDLLQCAPSALRGLRGKRISMIFQDPMTALNPYMKVGKQVMEPLRLHEGCTKGEASVRAIAMLEAVGIQDAVARMNMFPHEFSGGMRQRVMIAMALITKPELLIADEPTTALDVTVQAQILRLLKDLQAANGMSIVLITHDLGVIAGTCDRVLVMYAGRIVESGPTEAIFYRSRHPYTKALMASMPSTHRQGETLFTIPGLPPDLIEPIVGCAFAPRCSKVQACCRSCGYELREVDTDHATACIVEHGGVQ